MDVSTTKKRSLFWFCDYPPFLPNAIKAIERLEIKTDWKAKHVVDSPR